VCASYHRWHRRRACRTGALYSLFRTLIYPCFPHRGSPLPAASDDACHCAHCNHVLLNRSVDPPVVPMAVLGFGVNHVPFFTYSERPSAPPDTSQWP
jgi:hypothetical protein